MFDHDPYAELATLRAFPPLTVTSDEVDEAVAMIADALATQIHEAQSGAQQ